MAKYPIPAGAVECEYEVKKSRFVALLHPVSSREEAMQLLNAARTQYPDARHHCWAYQLGNPNNPNSAAMSDDGEPSGTAGKPILNVIQHKDLSDVLVIIVRYFGGIKLGAGGLVRAYSTATQMAFEQVEVKEYIPTALVRLSCSFDEEQKIRHLANILDGEVLQTAYTDCVTIDIEIAETKAEEFKTSLVPLKNTEFLND